jgi:hypothetical protein
MYQLLSFQSASARDCTSWVGGFSDLTPAVFLAPIGHRLLPSG